LLDALRRQSSAVLRAPTGAGKTTRVPPALLDAGLAGPGRIILLEPRRLAARAAARHMACEPGSLANASGFLGPVPSLTRRASWGRFPR
jgi:ATP-dependent helicase HrpB